MNKLKQIDDKLIDLTQDGYLWLYDRTGIYLATCAVVSYLVGFAFTERRLFDAVMCGIMILSVAMRWAIQDHGQLEVFNSWAREIRRGRIRYPYLGSMLFFSVTSASVSSLIFNAAIIFGSAYLLAAQIRDREPKDLFQSPKLAGSNA